MATLYSGSSCHTTTSGTTFIRVSDKEFYDAAERVDDQLNDLQRLQRSLHYSNESLKTFHEATAVCTLRAHMDADVALILNKVRLAENLLKALRTSHANITYIAGSDEIITTDLSRRNFVTKLCKKLRESMDAFHSLERRMSAEYREAERLCSNVIGENADKGTVDALVALACTRDELCQGLKIRGEWCLSDLSRKVRELLGDTAVVAVKTQGESAASAEILEAANHVEKDTVKLFHIIVALIFVLPLVIKKASQVLNY